LKGEHIAKPIDIYPPQGQAFRFPNDRMKYHVHLDAPHVVVCKSLGHELSERKKKKDDSNVATGV
jgi:hypothetical protein